MVNFQNGILINTPKPVSRIPNYASVVMKLESLQKRIFKPLKTKKV